MSRKLYRECYIPGVLVVLLMLVVSFFIRVGDFEKVPPAPNMEASYHVILTMSALKESPIVNHWFLPTVSLGGTLDKNIPWGGNNTDQYRRLCLYELCLERIFGSIFYI